ncbi:MAG: methylmalonyl-CoA mutase, partial [Dehalococcoidia bacterium]
MGDEKTTKRILEERLAKGEDTPLYRPEVLKKVKEDFEHWKNTVVREQDRENWEVTPHTILGSEIPREL